MARVWWIPLVFAALLAAQQDTRQTPKEEQKTQQKSAADDSQKPSDEKYAEPQEEDEGSKPAREYVFNPLEAQYCLKVGNEYFSSGKYRPAIRQYKKALKLDPKAASIFSNLGTAYFARHKYKDALQAYQQAMALDPDVFEHRNSFGVLLQERAVDDLAAFHYYMSKVYAEHGVQDRALLYMRKALEEGFKDRARFREDPAFASLQKIPEFQQLLELQPRVL